MTPDIMILLNPCPADTVRNALLGLKMQKTDTGIRMIEKAFKTAAEKKDKIKPVYFSFLFTEYFLNR